MSNQDLVTCCFLSFLEANLHSPKVSLITVIPASWPFCIEESINLRFRVSILKLEFVGGHI